MEEAEALCNKVAILLAGQLVCIGTPQYLKDRFGAGYYLQIKLPVTAGPGEWARLRRDLVNRYPGMTLEEKFLNQRTYAIPTSEIRSLAKAFRALDEISAKHGVEEFGLTQTSLEQVFLMFANHYRASGPKDPKFLDRGRKKGEHGDMEHK